MQLISRMLARKATAATGPLLLLLAGAITPAYSDTLTRDLQRGASDQSAALQIYNRLDADPNYYYRHVRVSVHNGIATLSGYVWSTSEIYHARGIAARVPGVRKVITTDLELEREAAGRGSGG